MLRLFAQWRAAVAATCLVTVAAAPAHAGYTVRLDPSEKRGVWEGFGASLSWWAHAVGGTRYEDLYLKLFFGTETVTVNGVPVPGLGMNIARYNVGGGGMPQDDVGGVVDRMPAVVPWHKDIDGFWKDWFDQSPDSASWDWTRDAEQRGILAKLNTQGVLVEFFANAPMWWMTEEKSSAGGRLQAWNRRDHARYLATVVAEAKNRWGVKVRSVEPFNEPAAGWWTYPVQQEGANIGIPEQAEILGYLREELDARGLSDVVIAGSDENTMQAALDGYSALRTISVPVNGRNEPSTNLIAKVNVHGYNGLDPWRDDSVRRGLRTAVRDKRVWMSEYGDNEGSGLVLAQSILADFTHLRPNAWVYWQPLEPYSPWGLLNGQYGEPADETSAKRGQPVWLYTKYYVFAQFSRYIRPGYTIIGSTDERSVAAYDKATKRLVLVTLNEGPAQTITYDAAKFGTIGAKSATVVTTTLNGKSVLATRTLPLRGQRLAVTVPANAIHSIIIENVTPGRDAEELRSAATGQCIDVLAASDTPGAPAVQYSCADAPQQRWIPRPNGNLYTFVNNKSGACLNVNGESTEPGAAVIQWTCSGTRNEQFELRRQGMGVAMVAHHSGLCVGVEGASTAPNARLTQQVCDGSPSQTWYVPLGSQTLQSTGSYLCADIARGTLAFGTTATQWDCVGSYNQRWNLQRRTDGLLRIRSVNSGQCLQVLNDRRKPGSPVGQGRCAVADNQLFTQTPQNGGFALVAKSSGLCVVPEKNTREWGARLVQDVCDGSAFQTWR